MPELLALDREDPRALERIHPAGPDVWAQVRYAAEREWALTPEDVLRRRTTVAMRGLDDESVRVEVAERLDAARSVGPAFV